MGESKKLSAEQRKAIFRSVIEAQDAGQSVEGSRKAVAKQYEVSEELVKKIEQEGSDKDWPPL
jgi:ribonuclease HII